MYDSTDNNKCDFQVVRASLSLSARDAKSSIYFLRSSSVYRGDYRPL